MKIAVFHNFLDNIGGAEKVGLVLARELNADIYTTNIDSEKIEKMGFADVLPRIYSIGKIPINAPYRQQAALTRFRLLNLKNKYDFYIIDGDWAISGAANNKPNLWYVHSPIREIWDSYKFVRQTTVPPWQRPVFDLWVLFNRRLNKKYADSVDFLACNSNNTKARLKKFLGKDAVVINPPIENSNYYYRKNGDFWLSVNRLFAHKRIEMQMKAFAQLPQEKLVIIGSYEKSKHFQDYADYCRKIKPENVDIKSWASQPELLELYANCKGLVATSKDEDFGMNAVEAMAAGKPVIAPNEGGYRETVINNQTGFLINNINENNLAGAVREFGKNIESNGLKFKDACQIQAQKFDTKIFIEKIKKFFL